MGLPVPAEYPLTPIVYFDGSQPPFVPMVPVMPSVQHVLPSVAAAVANEAASKALANSARMFAHNLISQSNYANGVFGEVVKLCCDYVALNLAKGIARTPEMAIPEAVQTVLSLYTSTLLFQYPDLRALVDQRVINAASENAPQLENLKKEIADMHHYPPGHGMPGPSGPTGHLGGGYQGHGHVGAYAHAPTPGYGPGSHYPAYPQGGHYPMHNRPYGGPAHGGYPGAQYPNGGHPSQHVGHGSGFGHHGGRTMSVSTALSHASGMQASQASSDRFASRPQRGVTHHQQQNHQPAPAPATEKNAVAAASEELTIAQGSEMDRAAHQLTYFGSAYNQDLRPRAQRFIQSAAAMTGANADQPQQHVYSTWLMCSTLDDAITMGRSKQYETQQVNSRQDIYRCFAVVARPITSVEDIDAVMKKLLEANSFKGLATKIHATAIALEQSKAEMKTEDPDAIVSFLQTVDNRMTDLINGFLQINIGLAGMKIDSFTEDAPGLLDYLVGKGGGLAQAYQEFEREVFSVLSGEEFDQDALSAAYEGLEIPPGLKYTTIPENYSITFLFMNSRELGWTVGDTPVRVNRRTAPTLHRVIESLVEHKKSMGLPTLNDVIVTSDNTTYRIYRDYLRAGEYLISTK